MGRVALRTLLAGALLTSAAAVQERQTFRVHTTTVYVHATVASRDGRLVPDLTRDDFAILDDGEPREIAVFSNEIQPITVALLLDMSNSMSENVGRVREGAGRFVDALLPADRARIGSFGYEVALSPHLTPEKAVLRRVLEEELWPGGPTPLWIAVDQGMTSLAAEEGRRVVLVLTDGGNAPGGFYGHGAELRADDLLRRAEREVFMVYAIGFQGTGLDAGIAQLAQRTGGGHFVLGRSDDLGATFARVADELHHQYLLGFSPPTLDGKVHKLDVRVTRRNMVARARTSYLAAAAR